MTGPIFEAGDAPNTFVATPAAGGPWSDRQCHGGAPAALLAQIAEAQFGEGPASLARFTADLLRPTPVGVRLEVCTRVVRDGRRATAVQLALAADDQLLVRATALLVREGADPEGRGGPEIDAPRDGEHHPMPGGFSAQFTITPRSGGFGRPGPAAVWFRMNSPLVDRQEPTPVARAVACADFASGVAARLSFEDWTFPSLDLSVGLARPPQGEWILLEPQWLPDAHGRTLCATLLSDRSGPFGQATQTVLIDRRSNQG